MVINQLPVVVGKPYKPRQSRVNERWTKEVECQGSMTDGRTCNRRCYCASFDINGHEYRHGLCHVHTHAEEIEPGRRNGTGWLERKSDGSIVYHTPWLKTIKPFEMKPLKARVETSVKALARIKKELVSTDECKRYLAQNWDAQGFKMTATNGHWAIMERQTSDKLEGRENPSFAIGPKHRLIELDNPELHLAIKRAATMMDERSKTVFLIGDKSGLTVFSQNSEVGQFVETVSETATVPFIVALNYDYLEPVLGCWPLGMWIRDEESMVVFESDDWRVVVMPIRADFDGARKAIKAEWATT